MSGFPNQNKIYKFTRSEIKKSLLPARTEPDGKSQRIKNGVFKLLSILKKKIQFDDDFTRKKPIKNFSLLLLDLKV
jgi:hypothetical protein